MRSLWFVALIVAVGSCGGGRTQIAIGPPPAPKTVGALAGPLCQGDQCKCREGAEDGGAGLPEGASKRFEVKLGPTPHDLWLSMPGGTVLYKSKERPEACFYIDLAPGEHTAELRASQPEGVSVALAVRELGTQTKSWYDTFTFNCGSPGVCSFDELESNKAAHESVRRGLHDPCGSVKVKGVIWDHGKAPDQMHPSELVVRFTLDVYKFAPKQPHGDNCEKSEAP
jgi:hypothetical protein